MSGPELDLLDDSGVVFEIEDDVESPDETDSPEVRLAIKKADLRRCAEDMVNEHSEALALANLAEKIKSGLREVNTKLLEKKEIVQYFIERNEQLSNEVRVEEVNIKIIHLESSLKMKELECEQLIQENQRLMEKNRLYEEAVNDKGKVDVGALLMENSELKARIETLSNSNSESEGEVNDEVHDELQSETTFFEGGADVAEWKEAPRVKEYVAEEVKAALSAQRKSMKHLFFVGQRVRNRFLERNSKLDPKERHAIYELGNSSVYNGRPITDATLFSDVPGIAFEKRTDEQTFIDLYWANWSTVLRLQDCAEFIEMLRWHSSVKAWRKNDYMETEFFKTWYKGVDTRFEDMDVTAVREYCNNITRKKLKACYLEEKKRNMKTREQKRTEPVAAAGNVVRWGILLLIVLIEMLIWTIYWLDNTEYYDFGDWVWDLEEGWGISEGVLTGLRTALILGWAVGENLLGREWNWYGQLCQWRHVFRL
ncbi:hypothetical protein CJF30_00002984 [Rutstroemia sp. NJR-2017a BBW]|nr:hypothetical protein CJF30_00002984 [Rutstroemia sp. NJR-2017a BBW]